MPDAALFSVLAVLVAAQWRRWSSGAAAGVALADCAAGSWQLWQLHAASAAILASTLAALACAACGGAWWARWRGHAVAAYRLGWFWLLPSCFNSATKLSGEPGGLLSDAFRVAIGCRAVRLAFLDAFLPLPPRQLLMSVGVQTACLAYALAAMPAVCSMPALDHPTPAARIAWFHSLVAPLLTPGVLPPTLTPGGPKVQCVAALNSLCIFAGWLLPFFFALRRHRHAAELAGSEAAHPLHRFLAVAFLEDLPLPEQRALAWAVHAGLSYLLGWGVAAWAVGGGG